MREKFLLAAALLIPSPIAEGKEAEPPKWLDAEARRIAYDVRKILSLSCGEALKRADKPTANIDDRGLWTLTTDLKIPSGDGNLACAARTVKNRNLYDWDAYPHGAIDLPREENGQTLVELRVSTLDENGLWREVEEKIRAAASALGVAVSFEEQGIQGRNRLIKLQKEDKVAEIHVTLPPRKVEALDLNNSVTITITGTKDPNIESWMSIPYAFDQVIKSEFGE